MEGFTPIGTSVCGLYQVDVSLGMYTHDTLSNTIYLRRNGEKFDYNINFIDTWVQTYRASSVMAGRSLMIHLEEGDNLDLFAQEAGRKMDIIFCVKLTK